MIRQPTLNEVPTVVEMWRQILREHRAMDPRYAVFPDDDKTGAAWIASKMADKNALVLVWERGGKPDGYSLAYIEGDAGYWSEAYVQYREEGVGTKLLECTLAWFRNRGVKYVYGDIFPGNAAIVGLMRKFDFKPFTQRMRLDL